MRTKSGDSVAIYFTSGTTGAPKMVEHSQCSYGLGFVASGRYWDSLSRRSISKGGGVSEQRGGSEGGRGGNGGQRASRG